MTKSSFILIALIAVLTAGIACAADQPAVPTSDSQPAVTAPAADQPADDSQQDPSVIIEEEGNSKPTHVFGLAVGSYSPLNSDVKDTFGGTKVRVGLRPILTETPDRVRFMWDVSFYSLEKDNNQAVVIPLTIGLLKGFGQGTKTQSYAAINAGMFYGDVLVPDQMLDHSGWGFTANATVGLIYNKRLSVELRYEIMDKFAGYEFDSLSLMAGYKVLSWRF